jgi:Uma2 family endonuclease
VDQYERMVSAGILPETNRFELIEGRIVEKGVKRPPHSTAATKCQRAIGRLLPAGWHARKEEPVRIPGRRSEPEPDVSVVRGEPEDYEGRHPGPADVALVVEVARARKAKDRKLAPIYAASGIPAFWIVDVGRRRHEVYSGPVGGTYPAPAILTEDDFVNLVIDGQTVGRIAVADLLPRK